MKVLRQIHTNLGILFKARRNRVDLMKALARRPQLLLGTLMYEVAVMCSARVDARLKILAELKVAAIVACEYCLDIGSALAHHEGLTATQLKELHIHRTSTAFDDEERLVLDLAEALTKVPSIVDDELRTRVEAAFTPAQRTELMTTIAWENKRARLNQGLGVRPSGFSDGAFCAVPQPVADAAS
jgi:AhpD family alkylhydroperoxidase